MSDLLVKLERHTSAVGVITLDRPDRLNALSSLVIRDLGRAVDEVTEDPEIRTVVVAGEGKAFCAGADIAELGTLSGPMGFAAFVHRMTDVFGSLDASPKPSIAAVHGVAMGGGLELALSCDLRIVEQGARLGVPEIKLGLLPGAGGTARLPRLLPRAVAKAMLLTGEPLSADEAHRLGLVNQVVEEGACLTAALALAESLAGLAPLALAAGKRLIDQGAGLPLASAVTFERETVSMLFGTDDRVEGVTAFLEKRPPEFMGR